MRPLARIVLALTALAAQLCAAASVETLLMPGKVIEGHAKFEADCGQCHDRSNRVRQTQLCLACHEDVAADVRAGAGFHGRVPNVAASECNACHSEHQGRTADIVKFTATAFDHALTDFPLKGAHSAAACGRCHREGQPFRAAPQQCVDCHRERDPHAGRLGANCASCHAASAWTQVKFDHARSRFALTAAHAKVECAACHADHRYKDTPRECVACHAVDDVHRGARGTACANCHDANTWAESRFDHRRETGFALLGAHSQAPCGACHRAGDYQAPIPNTCQGCHRADDAHATRFGAQCERCHTVEAWRPATFDHLRDAKFALTGPHARLDCHRCHTADASAQKFGAECRACHASDDVHGGIKEPACQDCHGGDAWRPAVRFDHDLSAFPLIGLHVALPCASCHSTHVFTDAKSECNACHAKDDVHRGALGAQCADCHTANGWPLWEFDHAKTRFALDGAHSQLQCAGCHREPAGRLKLASDCLSCHRGDDVHLGQFGQQCQQCHTTSSFKGARRR